MRGTRRLNLPPRNPPETLSEHEAGDRMAAAALIVGLGNPGAEYALTRHNLGFWAVDGIARAHRILMSGSKCHAVTGGGALQGWKFMLAKPQTFMNSSGKAVRALLTGEGLEPKDLLVIHDDMDIELGRVKFKKSGGDAGHNGIGSIIHSLDTDAFSRLRIGLGRPPDGVSGADWVLESFLDHELETAQLGVDEAVRRASDFVVGR